MEQVALTGLWERAGTLRQIRSEAQKNGPAPLMLDDATLPAPEALLRTLEIIGVVEVRSNSTINVPDIFRVEARIKPKGGVKPPRRG